MTFGKDQPNKEKAGDEGDKDSSEIVDIIEQINQNAHHNLSIDRYVEMYKKLEKFLLSELKKNTLS